MWHVLGERRCAYMVLVMMSKGKEHGVDERIILKKIFEK
jgi:hypothetical protein